MTSVIARADVLINQLCTILPDNDFDEVCAAVFQTALHPSVNNEKITYLSVWLIPDKCPQSNMIDYIWTHDSDLKNQSSACTVKVCFPS